MGAAPSDLKGPPGYKVLDISRDSPAQRMGLEVHFDHIIEVNGTTFQDPREESFADCIRQYENTPTKFVIFNSRNRTFRDSWQTPKQWSKDTASLLGLTAKFVPNVLAQPTTLRVLNILPDSIAASAGLHPMRDYILGSDQHEFSCINDCATAIAAFLRYYKEGQEFKLYVYNATSETVRKVSLKLTPTNSMMGCDLGEGLLHRLPEPKMNAHRNAYSRYIYSTRANTSEDPHEIYIATHPIPSLPLSPPKQSTSKRTVETPEVPTLDGKSIPSDENYQVSQQNQVINNDDQ